MPVFGWFLLQAGHFTSKGEVTTELSRLGTSEVEWKLTERERVSLSGPKSESGQAPWFLSIS